MFKTIHDDAEERQARPEASALLAGLGIDPSRLLPFLAAGGQPLPAIAAEAEAEAEADGRPFPAIAVEGEGATTGEGPPLDPAPAATSGSIRDFTAEPPTWLRGNPAPPPAADPFGGFRAPPVSLSDLDPAELTRSLVPFSPDVLPISPAVSGIDRVVSASFSPPPAKAAGSTDPGDFAIPSTFNNPMPGPDQSGRVDFGIETFSSYSSSASTSPGGASGVEARLARAVDRLERIAELLDQSSTASRGEPSRAFRGRVDV